MNSSEPDLTQFKCRRCNECCKQPGFVYLKEGEAEKIAGFLGIDIYQFTGQYCDLMDRQQLVLKKREGESCIFLNDSGCTVYTARPSQCRDFPIRWLTPNSWKYCAGLKALKS